MSKYSSSTSSKTTSGTTTGNYTSKYSTGSGTSSTTSSNYTGKTGSTTSYTTSKYGTTTTGTRGALSTSAYTPLSTSSSSYTPSISSSSYTPSISSSSYTPSTSSSSYTPSTSSSSYTSRYSSSSRTPATGTTSSATSRTSGTTSSSTRGGGSSTASRYSSTTSGSSSKPTTSYTSSSAVSNIVKNSSQRFQAGGSTQYYKPIYEMDNKQQEVKEKIQTEELNAIVLDFGSSMCKAGVGGETIPRYVLPSVAGRPKHPSLFPGMTKKDVYVGEDAQQKRDVLAMKWPIQRGRIVDFNDVHKMLEHTFLQLNILPEEQPVLWSEAPLIPKEQREQMAEIMLEKMSIPAVHFVLAPVLSVYGCGRPTALVLDLGETMDVVPVYEGGSFSHAIEPAIKRVDITGADMTENLEQLLGNRGYYFSTPAERDIVEDIKEKLCYIAQDPSKEDTVEAEYKLPDGTVVVLGNERFRVAESLFVPALVGKEGSGLHAQLYNSIMESEIDLRMELARNILLTGGTSMLNGLAPRVKKELEILAPSSKWEIEVIAPTERKYAAWIGGSILGASDNFEKLCVTRELWDELGRSVVHDSQTW